MRGSLPARARAMASAAPRLWVGTSPSWRAASASRQPATSTVPSRSSTGRQPAQSANGRSGWQERLAVGLDRAGLGRGRALRLRPGGRLVRRARPERPQGVEERAVGVWVGCGNRRSNGASRITVPRRSGGKRSRHSRSAKPSAGRRSAPGSAARGAGRASWPEPRSPRRPEACRSSLPAPPPRSRASMCATEGGPPNTAVAVSSRGIEPSSLMRPRRRRGEAALDG